MRRNPNKIRQNTDDRIYSLIINGFMVLFLIVTLYPVYFVLVASFSSPVYVNSGELLLYPRGFTLAGYGRVFSDERILTGYINTLIYTIGGTLLGICCSIPAGYALSRKDLPGRGFVMALFVFTMYFGGGLIPTYLLLKDLNLINTRAIMIILGSVSVYNIILIRSYYLSALSAELRDAAFIDGCDNLRFFVSVAVPLSKAIIAVIGLYLAVGYWNSYFNALIYLSDKKKYPLQVFLREILLITKPSDSERIDDKDTAQQVATMIEVVKYGIIVVTTVPILFVYPFIQKYFVKGVMIGALKG